jgi:hypothetical protein
VEIVNESDSDKYEISEDQNNEEPMYLSLSISSEEGKEIPSLHSEPERRKKKEKNDGNKALVL